MCFRVVFRVDVWSGCSNLILGYFPSALGFSSAIADLLVLFMDCREVRMKELGHVHVGTCVRMQ